jgi:glyoxylase-like metal-dependent hydrolase (beta-lactamase superfamily II)
MKLAENLHRIGNDIVAAYLVEADEGLTLIDAGVSGQWSDLQAELETLGRAIGDIKGLILTHGDTDHVGFAERLRRDHGVPVFAHEADAPRARGEVRKSNASGGAMKIGPLLRFLWYAGRKGGLRTTWVKEVTSVTDGATLDLPGSPRIVHIPGHTPGSIAVHVPSVDAVFVGDALTTGHVLTGVQGPQPAPFTLDPETALASLAKIEGLGVTWVLPGHGGPWNGGVADAVRLVRTAAESVPAR